MLKLGIRSAISSLIATATFNMIYDINNIAILLFINIVLFIGLYIVNDKEDKLNIEYKSNINEIKSIFKDMKGMHKEIKDINILISKEVIKTNEKLGIINKEIVNMNEFTKQSIEKLVDKIESTNYQVNNISGNINQNKSDIIEAIKINIDTNKNIIDKYKETQEDMLQELSAIINLDRIYEIIENNHKDITNVYGNIENEIKKYAINETINIGKATDRIIDSIEKSNEEQNNIYEEVINESIEKLIDEIESANSQMVSISKDIKRNKSDIIEAIEINTDINKNVIDQYKEIQGAMLKELNVVVDKNKHITELLMSNYKVLNAIMES